MARRVKYVLAHKVDFRDKDYSWYALLKDTPRAIQSLKFGLDITRAPIPHVTDFCRDEFESLTSTKLKPNTAQHVRITPLKSGGFSFKLTGKPFDIK